MYESMYFVSYRFCRLECYVSKLLIFLQKEKDNERFLRKSCSSSVTLATKKKAPFYTPVLNCQYNCFSFLFY